MIVLDSSAILAVMLAEPEKEIFLQKMNDAQNVGISAATVLELGIVLSVRKAKFMGHIVDIFLQRLNAEIIPFTEEHQAVALRAFWTYGKSRHSAALNYGDCISYATAIVAEGSLLAKGNDFSQTDITLVPLD